MAIRLKQEALEFLKNNDAILYGPLSQALNVKVGSIEIIIGRNSRRLIEYPALKIIADHMGKEPHELIEEYAELSEQDS